MKITDSPELFYLILTTALTGIIWIPYILNRIVEMGLWSALKNPQPDDHPEAQWAFRAMNAHRNAIENLMIFAPLAVAVHVLDLSTQTTAFASMLFFVSRLIHLVVYTLGIPLVRTLSFAVGFLCQTALFVQLISG